MAILGLASCAVVAGGVVEPRWGGWGSQWGVADDWRLTHDWNRDGIIDWRDDYYLHGERPWAGDWLRADWNRDGALDWRDGWRRWDNTWGVGAVEGVLPAGAWRADGAVVREIPATGFVDDWRHIDGPWGVNEWGRGLPGWDNWNAGWNGWNGWNGAAVDDWAWRDGWRGDLGPRVVL
ncbi:unnamed protein product [Moneuplotes crassus]|uniref:Uncharacterized protein n=1 Tax=Euplotes crassus TaxID=5936 RepID=A0AAD2D675_EUPCR|nr:unnamed protein product [Moneuplotes crassus]